VATKWNLGVEWPEQQSWDDPELVVTFFGEDIPYAVFVELRKDEEGPFVTGVCVRRHIWADGWKGERTYVSPRDIQRLPLARMVRAALAAAATVERPEVPELPGMGRPTGKKFRGRPDLIKYDYRDEEQRKHFPPRPEDQWAEDARRILVPRGRPQRGRSASFYREIADSHRNFTLADLSPVKEIARRKRVSENTVHQWVHRARKLGFLEPSPRSKRKEPDDA
jgi:hypothetical protein